LRQGFPDGSVWVRTEPITYLHDRRADPHAHGWHQLTFARSGHLEVETDRTRALVPPDRAVWIPAGTRHREAMWAPVRVRTLYVAPGAAPDAARTRTLSVSPLLRELIDHACLKGALRRDDRAQSSLIDVLLDLLGEAPDATLQLPLPADPRARRLAERLRRDPGDRATLAALARGAGASVRTLERLWRSETGLRLGQWRRRLRLLEALRRLDAGGSVSEVAAAVGYATPSAFTAAFTRFFGVPPTRR